MSKGHRIYAPNQQITIELNISFEDTVLRVPNILIAGEDKDNSIVKPSNQNTAVQQIKQPVEHQADIISHSASVAPGISADKNLVDAIMRNMEKKLSGQLLR